MKFYNCSICGNKVELLVNGGGTLVCCGEEMEELTKEEIEKILDKKD